jgi:hypothetical protein
LESRDRDEKVVLQKYMKKRIFFISSSTILKVNNLDEQKRESTGIAK